MHRSKLPFISLIVFAAIALLVLRSPAAELKLQKDSRVVLLGGGLGSRMLHFGHFETEMHRRYPEHHLVIRNLCDEGDTPAFRPNAGRKSPWAFPGGEKFRNLVEATDNWGGNSGEGLYPEPDAWLKQCKPDIIVAFFGFNESFDGMAGLPNFKAELETFVDHTLKQTYNDKAAPQLVLVSPTAFQDLSVKYGTPNGITQNANLALYTKAMEDVAAARQVPFVNLFAPTSAWFVKGSAALTRDGALLTDEGYAKLAPLLVDQLFGASKPVSKASAAELKKAVADFAWMWLSYYKIPNGVHVYGRRREPFGSQNYPAELHKLEQMVQVRERAIWALAAGEKFDVAAADAKTDPLADVGEKDPTIHYLSAEESLKTMVVPQGYKIELFADESKFPDLANPSQLSFDNKGRLWVAVMPVYPHYRPGDPLPNDKLIILEDTDDDGRADKQTTFVDGLHLPMGFEFSHDGVYVAQGNSLMFYKDTNGDDKADVKEIVMSGFDDHDTHHAISAFCADPSGAILMAEGTFLRSHIETAYGPIRSSNGGFFRYNPERRHLERTARISVPNPWGIAFDEWGQDFFADTSDPNVRWMLQGSLQVPLGSFSPTPPNLLSVLVRPTSGLEFVSSRHFPDEVQGDLLINNTIGFLGTKQHTMKDEGTGFVSTFRHDLVKSSDPNFRPVDMEFAPDGSLYLVDWHNARIGHMQHSARDPNRDHAHGRIFRMTYPSRPLVKPAKVAGASIQELLENLQLPECRTRYRSRRELRGRDHAEVLAGVKKWGQSLNQLDPNYEHHLVEALWVTWGINQVSESLVRILLKAKDPHARAAAVRALRYNGHSIPDQTELLKVAAADENGRVRLEAIVAASWLANADGLSVLDVAAAAKGQGGEAMDQWITPVFDAARAVLKGQQIKAEAPLVFETQLIGVDKQQFLRGSEVYLRDGYCTTCHQKDGNGLPESQYPPLAGSEWVQGDESRLISLVLHGLMGPIEVKGVKYAGTVPMTPFKFLKDEEVADVLTFVRNAFGNKAPPVTPQAVQKVRAATQDQKSFYQAADLSK
jgi:mono/diheme cytochrome c family protein/glucose/arabinose dehydrogenase/lysophospholipase L1-like esterase